MDGDERRYRTICLNADYLQKKNESNTSLAFRLLCADLLD